jgi:N-methylhydantoinase B
VNRYQFVRNSDVLERLKDSRLVGDINELQGTHETLQLRQQDIVQNPSDVYAVLWSAAGGFGDPLERDPARVEADVDNGDVSLTTSREVYGVIIGDPEATERERALLRRQRLESATMPLAPATKLNGKIKFLAAESLAVRQNGKKAHFACAKCATDLGPVTENYKKHCARNDRAIQRSNPLVGDPQRFINPVPQFRQFSCPNCGLLIENEVAIDDDGVLVDVELVVK